MASVGFTATIHQTKADKTGAVVTHGHVDPSAASAATSADVVLAFNTTNVVSYNNLKSALDAILLNVRGSSVLTP